MVEQALCSLWARIRGLTQRTAPKRTREMGAMMIEDKIHRHFIVLMCQIRRFSSLRRLAFWGKGVGIAHGPRRWCLVMFSEQDNGNQEMNVWCLSLSTAADQLLDHAPGSVGRDGSALLSVAHSDRAN